MGRFGTSRGLIKEVFRKGEAKPEYDLKKKKQKRYTCEHMCWPFIAFATGIIPGFLVISYGT